MENACIHLLGRVVPHGCGLHLQRHVETYQSELAGRFRVVALIDEPTFPTGNFPRRPARAAMASVVCAHMDRTRRRTVIPAALPESQRPRRGVDMDAADAPGN